MIIVENVQKSFGVKEVLRGVDFTVPTGVMAGLIGPSGGGKSVLLKAIAGVDIPDAGRCFCDDAAQRLGDDFPYCANSLSLMFQEGALFDSLTVFDNVAFPLTGGRVPTSTLSRNEILKVHARVDAILARVGLSAAAYKMPGQLSGGMRRRVSLARALVTRPKVLLLDDPTSGLDPVASSVIMHLVAEMHAEYKPTILIVSHDLRRLLPVVNRVYALFDGRIVFDGEVGQIAQSRHDEMIKFVACRFDLHAALHSAGSGQEIQP